MLSREKARRRQLAERGAGPTSGQTLQSKYFVLLIVMKLASLIRCLMHLQLLARVQRACIYFTVDVSAQVLQGAVVSKSPPLRIDTHPPFISIQQLDVPHMLHVAGISARSFGKGMFVSQVLSGSLSKQSQTYFGAAAVSHQTRSNKAHLLRMVCFIS